MSLDIVVVMDGPETVVPATDTSFGLVVAAGERGHRCWHCGPGDLSVVDGTVRANVRPIRPDASGADPLGLGDEAEIDLGDVDVVLVRPDPPFDQRYLHLTLMLDLVEERTLVVNSPRGQRYLPGVCDGDKRILLLDGEPLGAVLRRPTGADFRANICVGGAVELVDLDATDHRIVAAVAPALRADGLAFVGIDVVDGHLTEVNVTSPTGLRQLCDLSGERPDLRIVRWLEDHVRRPASTVPPGDVMCEDSVDG